MSHHNSHHNYYSHHGRSSVRPNPTGGDSGDQSPDHIAYLQYQMADIQEQADHFPGDVPPLILPQAPDHALPNARFLPAADNGPFEGHWAGLGEDIPQQARDFAEPGGPQDDAHHLNVAHHGMAEYHPLMLGDHAGPYVFPGVELAQGIPVQGRANVPQENQEYVPFGYAPQDVVPRPVQVAFPHPDFHQDPAVNRPREDNLRRLASRFLYHPDSQVNVVHMEPRERRAGRFEVVIILEASDVL